VCRAEPDLMDLHGFFTVWDRIYIDRGGVPAAKGERSPRRGASVPSQEQEP
jgi:hypothetical protein